MESFCSFHSRAEKYSDTDSYHAGIVVAAAFLNALFSGNHENLEILYCDDPNLPKTLDGVITFLTSEGFLPLHCIYCSRPAFYDKTMFSFYDKSMVSYGVEICPRCYCDALRIIHDPSNGFEVKINAETYERKKKLTSLDLEALTSLDLEAQAKLITAEEQSPILEIQRMAAKVDEILKARYKAAT